MKAFKKAQLIASQKKAAKAAKPNLNITLPQALDALIAGGIHIKEVEQVMAADHYGVQISLNLVLLPDKNAAGLPGLLDWLNKNTYGGGSKW